jgi:hypothetical protein
LQAEGRKFFYVTKVWALHAIRSLSLGGETKVDEILQVCAEGARKLCRRSTSFEKFQHLNKVVCARRALHKFLEDRMCNKVFSPITKPVKMK